MIQLSREIRFSLTPQPEIGSVSNSWAGWPSTNRIVPYLILKCVVAGNPDPQTGYVCNIKLLDDLLREVVTTTLIPTYDRMLTAEEVLRTVWREANAGWELNLPIIAITLELSPYLKYEIGSESSSMIRLTQQFEFSAAHRLHCDEFSDEKNQEIFGKCNNPNGHGHNYVVEVTVARKVESDSGAVIALHNFESTVKRLVVDRLDHKHLNEDVEYFEKVVPSVENIAIAIWDWLDGKFEAAQLNCIRVYETPKTWAEYRGPI